MSTIFMAVLVGVEALAAMAVKEGKLDLEPERRFAFFYLLQILNSKTAI
jgi:hypothetical protein